MQDTRERILNVALAMARQGLSAITLRGVAARVGVDHRTVVYHFGALGDLQETVAREALARKDGEVIARLIIDKHRLVDDMPLIERRAYLAELAD